MNSWFSFFFLKKSTLGGNVIIFKWWSIFWIKLPLNYNKNVKEEFLADISCWWTSEWSLQAPEGEVQGPLHAQEYRWEGGNRLDFQGHFSFDSRKICLTGWLLFYIILIQLIDLMIDGFAGYMNFTNWLIYHRLIYLQINWFSNWLSY